MPSWKKAKAANEPFFVWMNTSRMHVYTLLDDEWRYAAGKYTSEADLHGSGMMQHDHAVGMVLDWLEQQGILDDTLIWYSTDNGPEHDPWPHGATTPFRGEKMTAYEGGVRVISMLRYPRMVPQGQVLNGIQAHQDMFTSLAAVAGMPDVNIRMDPFESFDSVDAYRHLLPKVSWLMQPMGVLMNTHLKTLAEYPPVQGGASFDMSNVVAEFMEQGLFLGLSPRSGRSGGRARG
ncbi:sulfatase-like hydrolase/transferase [Novosphingobium sp. BW1]|uniref:sulfatase-like hydrolase/transferase n=1 Tax=Novosphingobium sp. BW1 TaxID=2592621 RepID=UPI001F083007|nr:sulfatase-like hydrolase/transferase [Novosphingobium sp. BW1]